MEPLKRQILYVKPKIQEIAFPNTGILKTNDKKLKALDNSPANASLPERLQKSKLIADWIVGHPEFKWSGMCKKLGIDKGNFGRSFKADPPNLGSDIISKVEVFLKDYGFLTTA